jgi:hypothetical protein
VTGPKAPVSVHSITEESRSNPPLHTRVLSRRGLALTTGNGRDTAVAQPV